MQSRLRRHRLLLPGSLPYTTHARAWRQPPSSKTLISQTSTRFTPDLTISVLSTTTTRFHAGVLTPNTSSDLPPRNEITNPFCSISRSINEYYQPAPLSFHASTIDVNPTISIA